MKHRVEEMLKIGTDGWWIGTFHAMGARILRKHQEIVGLKSQFSIIDIDDQIRLIKQALSYHNVDEKNGQQDYFTVLFKDGKIKD